jgi:hypothetical protein
MRAALVRFVGVGFIVLVAGACFPTGGLPRIPFADIPVPADATPYTNDWVYIDSPTATAAKLIYLGPPGVEEVAAVFKSQMIRSGWKEEKTTVVRRPVPEPPQTVMEFAKGADTCRVTLEATSAGTHIEMTIARVKTLPH